LVSDRNRLSPQELSRRSVPAARDSGRSQVDKTVERLEKAVHGMRRQYDKVMQVRAASEQG
jgi:hypothetical protein